ncbi:sulfotransferase domain-containing protein [Alkalibacillus salilacus]|uniref:sulfotransferase domain-containing protein n=1 Tax=Alkalibacillus salilacus TaxID=284582 RepID=UPI0027D87CA3|nr:sulfotransferase domain-containing protein [Alkalibacillus salilacus]
MRKTIYLHIGYHKTATTFLQKNIFPNLKKVRHIKNKKIKDELYRLRVRKLNDEDILEIRNRFDELGKEGKPTLISYEGLSGSPFKQKKPKKHTSILKDLRRVFPEDQYDVKLIIGIREQVQMMTSLYIQYLHMGGYKQADDYLQKLEDHDVLDQYKYNEYLNLVEDIFGDDYYLFIYENLKKDPDGYLLKLLNYLGVKKIPEYDDYPTNKSYGVLQARLARRLNYFFKTKQNPEGKFEPKKTKRFGLLWPRTFLQNKISYKIHYKRYTLPEEMQRQLQERYKEDNIKLSERENVSLPSNYLY